MSYDPSQLPDDPVLLKSMIVYLHGTIEKLADEIRRLTMMMEKFFGKSSEKLPKKDETPEKQASKDLAGTPAKKEKNGGGGRKELPTDLPRVEKRIDVPEEERTCSCCGKHFDCIGEERSEQLHFKPMELYVVVQILAKYMAACNCSDKRSSTPIRSTGICSCFLKASPRHRCCRSSRS